MTTSEKVSPVIVVDDEPICLDFLVMHLQAAGHSVQTARNGQEVLELLKQGGRIVISDWAMPGMSGLELCRAIRSRPQGKQVYFIMVTGHSEKACLMEAFRAGVDDFLAKPVDEGELMARLRAGLRTVELQDELERRAEAVEQMNEQLVTANERLREMAVTDELTDIPNRRYAMLRLQEEWTRADRSGEPLSCAVLDLDSLKRINDHYGYSVGDTALGEIVAVMRKSLREVDVICRIGGDEFMILFPNQSAESVAISMERCRQAVAGQVLCAPKHNFHATISVGIAARTREMFRPHNLLHAADGALLNAKRAGGNRVWIAGGPTPAAVASAAPGLRN